VERALSLGQQLLSNVSMPLDLAKRAASPAEAGKALSESIFAGADPFHDYVALFLVQASLIIVLSRLFHAGLSYAGVPRVVSEVLAGIVLGQTALGKLENYKTHLFPAASVSLMWIAAEFGLILFFFLVCHWVITACTPTASNKKNERTKIDRLRTRLQTAL
jgi:hypothetical protein